MRQRRAASAWLWSLDFASVPQLTHSLNQAPNRPLIVTSFDLLIAFLITFESQSTIEIPKSPSSPCRAAHFLLLLLSLPILIRIPSRHSIRPIDSSPSSIDSKISRGTQPRFNRICSAPSSETMRAANICNNSKGSKHYHHHRLAQHLK
mgnify:CR=1 FL=1